MQPGRTPSWNLVAEFVAGAWLEPSTLGSDGRIVLPANVRKRLSWGSPQGSLPAVAIIESEGGVAVTPLSRNQDKLSAIKTALSAAPAEQRAVLILSAMASYSKLSLQPDGRLRLSPPVFQHLGEPKSTEQSQVWVAAIDDQLTLWPERVWGGIVTAGSAMLRNKLNEH